MAETLNSNGVRVFAYALVAAVCLLAYVRERQMRRRAPSHLWPVFWLLTAALLLAMGIARLTELSSLVAEAGRSEARETGWYEARRPVQATAVGALATAWLVMVFLVIWRVPQRRRRYVPTALAVLTLVCFAGIRAISLHHVDTLLYNRPLHGVRLAGALELCGLGLTLTAIAVSVTVRRALGGRDARTVQPVLAAPSPD